jgi:hypothetical protein
VRVKLDDALGLLFGVTVLAIVPVIVTVYVLASVLVELTMVKTLVAVSNWTNEIDEVMA